MSDLEFEILDELYFVISYQELANELSHISEIELLQCLKELFQKGWIKCFLNLSEELPTEDVDFDAHFKSYFYLATKSGLLMHNRS